MDPLPNAPDDPQPDWARLLPREAFHEIVLILRAALPPPLIDDPAEWARRDNAAMATVASLQPANAAEGRLAAQFVAADAYAMDCLRLAQLRRREPDIARKCAAQAASDRAIAARRHLQPKQRRATAWRPRRDVS